MNMQACPICGRPYSAIDVVLSEHDTGFQCRHCWNRAQATGPVRRASVAEHKPRILASRATTKTHRRKP